MGIKVADDWTPDVRALEALLALSDLDADTHRRIEWDRRTLQAGTTARATRGLRLRNSRSDGRSARRRFQLIADLQEGSEGRVYVIPEVGVARSGEGQCIGADEVMRIVDVGWAGSPGLHTKE
jgi:hypothetical protein